MQCTIVANAPFRFFPEAYFLAKDADLLLAADGGANHLARVGLKPHAVVGDLDSLTPSTRAWVGEERIVPRPDQNHTDLEKTVLYALEKGVTRIIVLAATGGRLDHTLENLGLLGRFCSRVAVEIREMHERIVPIAGEAEFAVPVSSTVSLVPLGFCSHVWTKGLHWALNGEPLDLSTRTGVSNRAEEGHIYLRVEGGILLAFLPW